MRIATSGEIVDTIIMQQAYMSLKNLAKFIVNGYRKEMNDDGMVDALVLMRNFVNREGEARYDVRFVVDKTKSIL